MSSVSAMEEEKEETPLFPVILAGNRESQDPIRTCFSSFQPPEKETKIHLDDLFSSDDEAKESERKPSLKRYKKESKMTKLSESGKESSKVDSKEGNYFMDSKGDRQNLLYQGIYRLDIPSYNRSFAASTSFGDTWAKRLSERYYAPKNAVIERSKRTRRSRLIRRKTNIAANSDSTVSVIPLSKGENPQEEELLMQESILENIQRRTRQFNERLRENPYNLSTWMKFALFQDEAISQTKQRTSLVSIAEKKMAILSAALKFHPKSEELLIQLLKLTAMTSSPLNCHEKYQAILSRVPHSLRLWKSYWSYMKSSFSEFSCEKMRGIYEGGFKALETALQERSVLVVQSLKAEEDLVEAFLLGIQFDFQSGYDEKAISKIQASLEWIFCNSENRKSFSDETIQQFFCKFWESSEIAKVGEKNAKGFAFFVDSHIIDQDAANDSQPHISNESTANKLSSMDTGWSGWFEIESEIQTENVQKAESDEDVEESVEEPQNQETEEEILKELGIQLNDLENIQSISQTQFEAFLRKEWERTEQGCFPIKPDSMANADLDRIVLFEELQPLLFDLHYVDSKKKLLLGILFLLGVDVSMLMNSNEDLFSEIQLNSESAPLSFFHQIRSLWEELQEPRITIWRQLNHSHGEFAINLLQFFSTELFQSDIRIRKLWLRAAIENQEPSQENLSTIKSIGRTILKRHSDDILLWAAYASILFSDGYETESRRVWKVVLKAMMKTGRLLHKEYITSIVSEILQASNPSLNILHLLTFVANGEINILRHFLESYDTEGPFPSPQELFHCQTLFESKLTESFSSELSWSGYENVMFYVFFDALYPFKFNNGFSEAKFFGRAAHTLKQTISRFRNEIKQTSKPFEALHERYCHWLWKSETPPKTVKSEIERSLTLFPSSQDLLLQLIRVHVASHTIATLLNVIKSHVKQFPVLDAQLLVILLEMTRSTRHLTSGSVFESILQSSTDHFARSPLVWRCYLDALTTRKSNDIKKVFLRAIRSCPWNKSIWLQGLNSCQWILKGTETIEFLETMKDKGLRIRTDVFEILLENAVEST